MTTTHNNTNVMRSVHDDTELMITVDNVCTTNISPSSKTPAAKRKADQISLNIPDDLSELFALVTESEGIDVTEEEVEKTVAWIEEEKVRDIMILQEYQVARFPRDICYGLIAAGWRYLKRQNAEPHGKKPKVNKAAVSKSVTVQQVEQKIVAEYGKYFPYEGAFVVTDPSTIFCDVCKSYINLKGPGCLFRL
eukprot:TRINITY_DN12758_c0_g1_i1.p1 TRINITY_DN12758_c0_g1~~TRINITY_DN12758_c0_g1_i1.p1  ORF type:complete len:193 (+),score=14.72 TRINITY_DN12758_c0_g1_i1:211-789(+)